MCKRLLMLTSLLVVLGLICPNAVFGTAVNIGIADDADDVEERLDRANVLDVTSSDVEMPYEDTGQGDPQVVGLRYQNVGIPKGAMVTAAWVQFQVDEDKGGTEPVNLIIEGELAANAEPFANVAFNVTSRVRTTAVVPWSVPNWTNVGDRGPDQATADITPIIQEIVDQDGWITGNALVLIISDDPANPSTGIRCAEAGPGDDSATLHVEFGGDPFLQDGSADGIVSMEAESFHNNTPQGDHTWEIVGPTDGFTGVAGMQSLPNTGTNRNADYIDNSPRLDFEVTLLKTGTYYVWVRAWGASGSDDSCHAGLDGQAIDTCDRMTGFNGNYTWSNDTMDSAPATLEVTSGGVHTLNIWMREDGAIIDKIVLTTNPDYVPEGDGPPESARGLPVNAYAPDPADGAIEVDTSALIWTGADGAVLHRVYLSADETVDETDLIAETEMTLLAVDLIPGTTYYWRVDEVTADGTVYEGQVWTFATIALEAHFPVPADGAENVPVDTTLSWTPGKVVVMHDLYSGTDEALVAAGDMSTFKGKLMQASYDPGLLAPFTTYYWRVDEFTPTGTVVGPVWSFSTPPYVVIDDGQTTLNYDNTVEPYVSEAAWETPADMTAGGVVSNVTFRFKGQPDNLSIDEATGTYDVAGSGADVWGNSDQFHYVYKELTGDVTITARVVSNGTGSNAWAKGGVMVRQSIDGGSQHAIMAITGGSGGGGAFQWRPAADGASSSAHQDSAGMAPGYWVRLQRVGNDLTGSYSADGQTWIQQGTAQTIAMTDPVLVGLFVTSHAAGQVRTYTFDNLSIEGNVSGDFVSRDVDSISGNSAAPVYAAMEDTTGAAGLVTHLNPAATQITDWSQWTIPLSDFAGVDPTSAAKLAIGVGDGTPGGAGAIDIAEIRVVEGPAGDVGSWKAAAQAGAPTFLATYVPDGLYDIGAYGGEQTYEFVVKSNPDETQASMALIGRRQFGDTQAGLKFEQWNNTGQYGATIFGVVDLNFGVPNNPGEEVHLVFVSSQTANTCALYVNGVYQASVDRAISLSGLVGIGYGAQGADGSGKFDDFDGVIYGVAIYDAALSDQDIAAHSDAYFGTPAN